MTFGWELLLVTILYLFLFLPRPFPLGKGRGQHAVIKMMEGEGMSNGPIRVKQINRRSSVIG